MENIAATVTNGRLATIGEKLVCLDFNVGGREDVNFIKRQFSMIADYMNNTVLARERAFQEKVVQFHRAYAATLDQGDISRDKVMNVDLPVELQQEQQNVDFAKQELDWALQNIKMAQMMCVGSLTRTKELTIEDRKR
jgi:hypothetical protein